MGVNLTGRLEGCPQGLTHNWPEVGTVLFEKWFFLDTAAPLLPWTCSDLGMPSNLVTKEPSVAPWAVTTQGQAGMSTCTQAKSQELEGTH